MFRGPSQKVCLFWENTQWSYADLRDKAEGLGGFLREECKLAPGTRVGLWMKNRPEFISCLFGCWFADAIVVPINNFLRTGEVAYILADAGIDVLLSETALGEGFEELRALRQGLRILPVEKLERMQWSPPSCHRVRRGLNRTWR